MNGGCTDESQSNMAPLTAETGSPKYPVLQQWSESPDVCTAGQNHFGIRGRMLVSNEDCFSQGLTRCSLWSLADIRVVSHVRASYMM